MKNLQAIFFLHNFAAKFQVIIKFMNSRKIKIFTLLLIALAMCPVASADNGSSTPIVFNYKPKTPIDGIHRPHRVPGNIHLSLEVFYDAVFKRLVCEDFQSRNYVYMILDENECIVSEGYLDFDNNDCKYISLDTLESGNYTLLVIHNGYEFVGTFVID